MGENGSKDVQPEPLADGYSKLAALYGQKPEIAIFKRFGRLNAENLLFLQAELLLLEQELKDIVAEDLRSGNEQVRLYARSWWAMKHYSQHGGDSLQWQKRIEIKKKLKEYNDAVIAAAAVYKIERPDKYDLELAASWAVHPYGGHDFPDDPGEHLAWGDNKHPINHDLLCLKPRSATRDRFTRWLTGSGLARFHEYMVVHTSVLNKAHSKSSVDSEKGSMSGARYTVWDAKTGLVDYSEAFLVTMADNISTVVASLLPVISTIVLYFVRDILARLGTIVGLMALFAMLLSIFTEAKRIEIFNATAAFAAVLVVFVGTTSNITNGESASSSD